MFSNNTFEDFGRDGVIPGSLGIDDRDRTLVADPQTVRFRPVNGIIRPGKPQLFQSSFQVIPGCHSFFLWRTFGFRLVGAQEDMTSDFSDPELFDKSAEPLCGFGC
jgi:hypothetical protein